MAQLVTKMFMPAWGDVGLNVCFINFVQQRGTGRSSVNQPRFIHKRCGQWVCLMNKED
jgi:hypothetical protein